LSIIADNHDDRLVRVCIVFIILLNFSPCPAINDINRIINTAICNCIITNNTSTIHMILLLVKGVDD